jgi:hypothetical protein
MRIDCDWSGKTVQRAGAEFVEAHPLNVFDRRIDDFVNVVKTLRWEDSIPNLPMENIQ